MGQSRHYDHAPLRPIIIRIAAGPVEFSAARIGHGPPRGRGRRPSSMLQFLGSLIDFEGTPMQNLRLILTVSAVLGTTAIATMSSAEARRYRHVGVYNDYVVSDATCSIVPAPAHYIYPAANWEPFFRRHVYRYGPILTCAPSIETTSAVSVRY